MTKHILLLTQRRSQIKQQNSTRPQTAPSFATYSKYWHGLKVRPVSMLKDETLQTETSETNYVHTAIKCFSINMMCSITSKSTANSVCVFRTSHSFCSSCSLSTIVSGVDSTGTVGCSNEYVTRITSKFYSGMMVTIIPWL